LYFSVSGCPDDTVGEGRIYAQPGNAMCPVTSFKKYLDKLHPKLDDLWQRPLNSYLESNPVWYCRSPLGKNTLGNMMAEISQLGNLSNAYSNHSIRATAITALDDGGIETRHIMRASGHKNEGSIRSYSCRLSEAKKREMSDCLVKC
jgi:integrase